MTPAQLIERPAGTTAYRDTARYVGMFGFLSSDGSKEYKIAYDTAQECWVCSCPGGINRGRCKHLEKHFVRRPTRADLVERGAMALREADAIAQAEQEKMARQRLKETPIPPRMRALQAAIAAVPPLGQRARIAPPPVSAPAGDFSTTRIRRFARPGEV